MTGTGARVRARVSYANVVSTLALFVAVGGASYAAATLPANSVGPSQLRTGAVGPGALGFPLGAQTFTAQGGPLPEYPRCNDAPPGFARPQKACFVVPRPTEALGHIHVRAPAQILLSAVASLRGNEPAVTTAEVSLALFVDRHEVDSTPVSIGTGEPQVYVPLLALVDVTPGAHALAIGAWSGLHGVSASVSLDPIAVTALAFPRGAEPAAVRCAPDDRLLC